VKSDQLIFGSNNNVVIPVGDVNKGLYIVKIINALGKLMMSKKLIK